MLLVAYTFNFKWWTYSPPSSNIQFSEGNHAAFVIDVGCYSLLHPQEAETESEYMEILLLLSIYITQS